MQYHKAQAHIIVDVFVPVSEVTDNVGEGGFPSEEQAFEMLAREKIGAQFMDETNLKYRDHSILMRTYQ